MIKRVVGVVLMLLAVAACSPAPTESPPTEAAPTEAPVEPTETPEEAPPPEDDSVSTDERVVEVAAVTENTPAPESVTIAGTVQSVLGCGEDWDPACEATFLEYSLEDDLWWQRGIYPLANMSTKLPSMGHGTKTTASMPPAMGQTSPLYWRKTPA